MIAVREAIMNKEHTKNTISELLQAVKWIFLSLITGVVCGMAGVLFHLAIDFAEDTFFAHPRVLFLLPAAGVLIAALYRGCRIPVSTGTDSVFEDIRSHETLPDILPPLIFTGSFLTHLCGGSSGREGAALQLGGGIAHFGGKLLGFGRDEVHTLELCGMGAVFSALFGTPVGAAFFVIEVIDVGFIHYKALFPCLLSSFSAFLLAQVFEVPPTRFVLPDGLSGGVTAVTVSRVLVLAALCGLISILFCHVMQKTAKAERRIIKNDYLRAAVFGALVAVMTLISGTHDYNGGGMQIVKRAIEEDTVPWAWALKLLFTAVTLGAGFKGGEIVPAFYVGATFGCFASAFLGISPALGAAIGMTALFCGVTNTPTASLLLALEIFSGKYLVFFALACGVSYFISGRSSLYHSQAFLESKFAWEK